MTDAAITPTEATGITNTARAYLAGFSLLFTMGVIVYVTAFGKAENSLHASSLSWAWTAVLVILGGIGLGAVLPTVLAARK